METTYNGFVIKFNEWSELWEASLEGHTAYSKPSLKAVKESIDKQLKSKFVRISAFLNEWRRGYVKVTITSIDEDGTNAWVTKTNGSRGKESLASLYADTPDNVALIEEINITNKQIKVLEDKVSTLNNTLQKAATN